MNAVSAHGALSTGSTLMTVTGALAMIVFVLVALAWVARRSGLSRRLQDGSHGMTLVASKSLGARERVVVMDVGEQRLILGVTASQISCLAVQARPEGEAPGSSAAPQPFPALLDKFRQKYRQDPEI